MGPSHLPSGTVTFLFTDIEGSTRLLLQLEDRYAEVLLEHRALLREAFQLHGGIELGTEGDALFYAFSKATDAVAAAQDGQNALANGHVRVRMGLHTGEPLVTDEGYVGVDLHLAARICSSAHGGQIVLSGATVALVTVQWRELGEYRLKDFDAPLRLYQLGQEDFPPLRTTNVSNLPVESTTFVGRAGELAAVSLLLRDHRLVTLVGPGGTGKTRLALQVAADLADEFEHGVCWVPLAAIRKPEHVGTSIAKALGLQDGIALHLASRQILLVLDNFEHVVEAAPFLADLLGSAARLKILVTSRESLRLAAEWEFSVPPLPQSDAIALFVDRASAIKSDFASDDAVAEICRRLDGLPLAVELAAGRVRTLSSTLLLDRLGRRLELLTAGARDHPERQRTLRATIDWSYDLLDEEEKASFKRLAVFSGGCTLSAADTVCDTSLDVLESLAAKSLVGRAGDRVAMLETIREYALDLLGASGELENLRDRHAHYFLSLAEEGGTEVELHQTEKSTKRLDDEHYNFRAALEHFIDSGSSQLELRLVAALWNFWFDQGRWQETTDAVQRALTSTSGVSPARVNVMLGAAWTSWRTGDGEEGTRYAEESVLLSRALGDPKLLARSLRVLGVCIMDEDRTRASALIEESAALSESTKDLYGLSAALNNLAIMASESGNHHQATVLFERALSISRSSGNERESSILLMNVATVERTLGDFESAQSHFAGSFALAWKLGIREVVVEVLHGLAALADGVGDYVWAGNLIGAAQRENDFGHVLEDSDRGVYEHTMSSLEQHLGKDGLDSAIKAGRALPPDFVIVNRHSFG